DIVRRPDRRERGRRHGTMRRHLRRCLVGRRGPAGREKSGEDRSIYQSGTERQSMNKPERPNSYRSLPDADGHFGLFGGRYVAETLMPLILELEKAYRAAKAD